MPKTTSATLSDDQITEIRRGLPSSHGVSFFNTGTCGPVPKVVGDAMAESVTQQLAQPRIGRANMMAKRELKSEARALVARMLHCDPSEIAITHNTTEGMNYATMAVNWMAGDEAITTDAEHPGAWLPLYAARDRFNITIKVARVQGRSPAEIIAEFERLCGPRTRLISLSHVSFSTGQVLPVKEIAEVAHKQGAFLLVDGAQSFAAIDLDMKELGCDFYAVPGQKWLCGPEGSGALYTNSAILSQTKLVVAGSGASDGFNEFGGFQVKGSGQRFEHATSNGVEIAGLVAAAKWFLDTVGAEQAYARNFELAERAIALLSGIEGLTVLTPKEHAGLVTAVVEGCDADAIVAKLAEQNILIRSIHSLNAIRLSTAFYTTESEIEDAVKAIAIAASELQ